MVTDNSLRSCSCYDNRHDRLTSKGLASYESLKKSIVSCVGYVRFRVLKNGNKRTVFLGTHHARPPQGFTRGLLTLLPRQGEPSHDPVEPLRVAGKSLHLKVKVHGRVELPVDPQPAHPALEGSSFRGFIELPTSWSTSGWSRAGRGARRRVPCRQASSGSWTSSPSRASGCAPARR